MPNPTCHPRKSVSCHCLPPHACLIASNRFDAQCVEIDSSVDGFLKARRDDSSIHPLVYAYGGISNRNFKVAGRYYVGLGLTDSLRSPCGRGTTCEKGQPSTIKSPKSWWPGSASSLGPIARRVTLSAACDRHVRKSIGLLGNSEPLAIFLITAHYIQVSYLIWSESLRIPTTVDD